MREGPAPTGETLRDEARRLLDGLVRGGKTLGFAESCTGGLLSSTMTEIPGSSKAFWGGVVSYSVDAKIGLLRVPEETIRRFGVVSKETAAAMATALLALGPVDLAIAVSGYAGPDAPAEEGGPGRVCLAWALRGREVKTSEERYAGDRSEIRARASQRALETARTLISEDGGTEGPRY